MRKVIASSIIIISGLSACNKPVSGESESSLPDSGSDTIIVSGSTTDSSISDLIYFTTIDAGSGDAGSGDAGSPDAESDAESDAGFDSGIIVISATHTDGIKNLDETSIDCGGSSPNKCEINDSCFVGSDCVSDVCSYNRVCLSPDERSCSTHFGGDTCGSGEVGNANAKHESCCRSLPVVGFTDPSHVGKTVYLDKYEITSGRMRAFVAAVTKKLGKPDIKSWIAANPPDIWDNSWSRLLPTDIEGGFALINRMDLGDPRYVGNLHPPTDVIVPPDTDQIINVGMNHQFGAAVFLDNHGNNCGLYAGSYGFPTYYYSPAVLAFNGEVPRSDATDAFGNVVSAQDALDIKSLNCSQNALFEALCHFDGGQLATSAVMDFITETPASLGNNSGCGSQVDFHAAILNPAHILPDPNIRVGGRCSNMNTVNTTFDAGGKLPTIFIGLVESPDPLYNSGNFLNWNIYTYPNYALNELSMQKSWQVSAPGRVVSDIVHLIPGDEGWMDIAGNLNEAVLDTSSGVFSGKFGVKYRGIGYGSVRSDLNFALMPGEVIPRIQRAEMKSALIGARCVKFK